MLFGPVGNKATRVSTIEFGEHGSDSREVIILPLTIPGYFVHIAIGGINARAFAPAIERHLMDDLSLQETARLRDIGGEIAL